LAGTAFCRTSDRDAPLARKETKSPLQFQGFAEFAKGKLEGSGEDFLQKVLSAFYALFAAPSSLILPSAKAATDSMASFIKRSMPTLSREVANTASRNA